MSLRSNSATSYATDLDRFGRSEQLQKEPVVEPVRKQSDSADWDGMNFSLVQRVSCKTLNNRVFITKSVELSRENSDLQLVGDVLSFANSICRNDSIADDFSAFLPVSRQSTQ
eukprot:Lithocolla_globosa_v1_NODE_271_length_4729_cov_185.133291.p6 type:complete len:113 gc:universal NODE_271_length_4729_cov_185.133291:1051-1389(+)